MSQAPLSTSALAKALDKTTKQMFAELESLGWIARKENSWLLTAKGEFEGGKYRESQKFGRYIIWPPEVINHSAISNPDSHLLSVVKLAQELKLTPKRLEQLLQDLGWVLASRKGWQLSSQGENVGGSQREHLNTAVPYVLWPSDLLHHPVLLRAIAELTQPELRCCDGHLVSCAEEQSIDNWLYFAGLSHAYQRRLPFKDELRADFYLPQYGLYIEYWGKGNESTKLVAKIHKKECILQAGFKLIELDDQDVANLDEVLPRKLLKYGIEV